MRLIFFIPISFFIGFLFQHISLILPEYANVSFYTFVDGTREWLDIDYFQFGFIRRAFIGTFLSFLPDGNSREIFYVIFNFICIITTLIIIFKKYYIANKSLFKYLVIIFSLSSLGAMQFGYTFGRFEQINYLILLLSINLISKKKFYLASIFISFGLLIHEAFLIYGLPLIICKIISRKTSKLRLKQLLIIFLPVSLLSIYLALFGNSQEASMLLAVGASREIIQTRSLMISDIFIFLNIFLILLTHLSIIKKLNLRLTALDYAPYSCLILFFLGIDYARWVGILFFIIFISLYERLKESNFKIRSIIRFNFSSYLLAFPLLGPLGIGYSYPLIKNFFEVLQKI